MAIAATPAAPYYAVIFTSLRTDGENGYGKMAEAMEKLAATQPGFLGIESARDGLGITVSYWESPESIAAWKQNAQHLWRRSGDARRGTRSSKCACAALSAIMGSAESE